MSEMTPANSEVEIYKGYQILTKEFYIGSYLCLAKFTLPASIHIGKIHFDVTAGTVFENMTWEDFIKANDNGD